jgi:N-dimethylarginine dimethylaminohydrolase
MIHPNCVTEYGSLLKVIMCFANAYDIDAASVAEDLSDEVSLHQYAHNDHRPYEVNLVRAQQRALINVIEQHGGEVILAPSLGSGVAQHYTRDVGFTIHGVLFRALPRRPYRQLELAALEPLRERFGQWHPIANGSIEGGDVLVDQEHVIIGLGEETTGAGIDEVERVLIERGVTVPVRRLTFRRRGVIHTDTLFNIVGPGTALIHREVFEDDDVAWLAKRYHLIDATAAEARALAINTLAIAPGKVVMLAPGGRLADEVARRGIEPILVDYSAVTALPGSFRCTTFPILRG